VTDLWELGDVAGWRAEVARHRILADEQRLPMFTWYAPLWAAVDALHAGRFDEAARLRGVARDVGERAGERNSDLFDRMLEFHTQAMKNDFAAVDVAFVSEKVADSPAGMAYRAGYAWILAGRGEHDGARDQLAIVARDGFAGLAFDTNWPSAVGEAACAVAILGDSDLAGPLYELLLPYAGRPLTAGRAIVSYGMSDRHLGLLASTLGDHPSAVAHLEAAIALDTDRGMRPWAAHGRRALADALDATGDHERASAERTRASADASELGLVGL
jgi:tetratricopeptide (TPR) repeat protein